MAVLCRFQLFFGTIFRKIQIEDPSKCYILKNQKMQKVLIALLIAGAIANSVVISSCPSATSVATPVGRNPVLDAYHTKVYGDFLKCGAEWLWADNGCNKWSPLTSAVFQSLFRSDCPDQPAKLLIAADDQFTVYLNGQVVGKSGTCGVQLYTFEVRLQCGVNNLTVSVSKVGSRTPAGLIFAVLQDKTKCYDCGSSPAAFYDHQSCQCQCSEKALCDSEHHWTGYPTCACLCNKQIFAPCEVANPLTHWSQKTCECECEKLLCKEGFHQNNQSCLCECEPLFCIAIKTFDPVACACVCPSPRPLCKIGYSYNENTCQCEPRIITQPCEPYPYPLPVHPIDPIDPIDPVDPIDPIVLYPYDPVVPICPGDPIEPIEPIELHPYDPLPPVYCKPPVYCEPPVYCNLPAQIEPVECVQEGCVGSESSSLSSEPCVVVDPAPVCSTITGCTCESGGFCTCGKTCSCASGCV